MKIEKFEDIIAWQKGKELTLDIYIIFKKLIKKHILTLKYICHIYYIARLYINLSPIWYMVMGNETALVE